MIASIQKKRQVFLKQIRKEQRHTKRNQIRKQIILDTQESEIRDKLQYQLNKEAAQFQERNVGNYFGNIQKRTSNYETETFEFLNNKCSSIKQIVSENLQNSQRIRQGILTYLVGHLPTLMKKPEYQMIQWPKSLIQLSLYILSSQAITLEQKRHFYRQLQPLKSIIKYLNENWDSQIRQNYCNDEYLRLFNEVILYSQAFQESSHSNISQDIQKLIKKVFKVINCSNSSKRKLKQRLSLDFLKNGSSFFCQQQPFLLFQNNWQNQEISQEESCKILQILANLFTLLPSDSHFNKQLGRQLLANVKFFYSSIYLNKQYEYMRLDLRKSLMILLTVCMPFVKYDEYLMIKYILNTQRASMAESICMQNINSLNKQFQDEISQQSIQSNLFSQAEVFFVRTLELKLLYTLSYFQNYLAFQDIRKWMKLFKLFIRNYSVVLDQFSYVINYLLCLLNNIITSQKRKDFKHLFNICIQIYMFFGYSGFQNLFKERYFQQVASILTQMIFNRFQIQLSLECFQQMSKNMDKRQNAIYNIFQEQSICLLEEALKKGYKYIKSATKEIVVLNLILKNRITILEAQDYMMKRQIKRLRKTLSNYQIDNNDNS